MQDPEKFRIRRCLLRQCVSCKSRFNPNPRLGNRQKTCGKESCRRTHRAGYRRQYRIKNPQSEQEYGLANTLVRKTGLTKIEFLKLSKNLSSCQCSLADKFKGSKISKFFNDFKRGTSLNPVFCKLVLATPDGVTWTEHSLPSIQSWNSVTYGNGIFVALGDSNTAATSPDGMTWTARTLPTSTGWNSVTYGNGVFVAVGSGTIAATSPDGITWTARTLPSSQNLSSVTYGNGIFLASNSSQDLYFGSVLLTSPDGITWTTRSLPSSSSTPYSIAYGNGVFVALGQLFRNGTPLPILLTSPDGIVWTDQYLAYSIYSQAITYGNGAFVALARGSYQGSGTAPWVIMTSP